VQVLRECKVIGVQSTRGLVLEELLLIVIAKKLKHLRVLLPYRIEQRRVINKLRLRRIVNVSSTLEKYFRSLNILLFHSEIQGTDAGLRLQSHLINRGLSHYQELHASVITVVDSDAKSSHSIGLQVIKREAQGDKLFYSLKIPALYRYMQGIAADVIPH